MAWRDITEAERVALGDGGDVIVPLGPTLTQLDKPWKKYDTEGIIVPWRDIEILSRTKGVTARALSLEMEDVRDLIFLSLEDIRGLCKLEKGYWASAGSEPPTCSRCGAKGYDKWPFCPYCGQAKYVR